MNINTSILNIDLLCAFSYLTFEESFLGKSLEEVCRYLTKDNNKKLIELTENNRLYYDEINKNSEYVDKSKVLQYIEKSNLREYKIVWINDKSEKYTDENTEFFKRKSGHKSIGFYLEDKNQYIFIIRGTNGSNQWLDNAKVIYKNISPSEKEAYYDFLNFYNIIDKNSNTQFILGGHSKGGLTALMVGAFLIRNNIKINLAIHTFYAPFLNKNRINFLLDGKIDKLMEKVNSIEIHIADIVSHLFIYDELLKRYSDKIYIVGDFKESGYNFFENHQPLQKIIKDGKIVINKNYDKDGIPKKSLEKFVFSKIIRRISLMFCEEKIEITNPFLVSIMKKSELIRIDNNKIYDNNNLLKDFTENLKKPDLFEEISFSFESLVENKKQAYLTYKFFNKIIIDDELQNLLIEFFEDKETISKLFDNRILAHYFSEFGVSFIKSFRAVENKYCESINYENFDENKIIEYMTRDIIEVVIHEEFKRFFQSNYNNNFKNILNSLQLLFKSNNFIFNFLSKIIEVIEYQLNYKSNNKKESEILIDKEIIEIVRKIFIK